jgi:hypothetical protein
LELVEALLELCDGEDLGDAGNGRLEELRLQLVGGVLADDADLDAVLRVQEGVGEGAAAGRGRGWAKRGGVEEGRR